MGSHCQLVVNNDATTNTQLFLADLSQLLPCSEPDEFGFVGIQLQSVRRHPTIKRRGRIAFALTVLYDLVVYDKR